MINRTKRLFYLGEGIINYNLLRHFKTLAPTELQINVTYKCNSRCQMCHIWQMKPKNELTTREWQKLMRDPIFQGIRKLNIAGGEPFLHPRLEDLINIFLISMPKLSSLEFTTNGFLCDRIIKTMKKIIPLCQEKNVSLSISVSLDGIGKTHEEIRRIPNAFEKAKSTILALKRLQEKYNFWLGSAGVISHLNLSSIKDVEIWCQKQKIPFSYQIVGFHRTYVANLEEKQRLDFTEDDKNKLMGLLKDLASRKSLKDFRSFFQAYYWQDIVSLYQGKERTTPCPFILDSFVLDSLGDVYYCLSEPKIGNCRTGQTVSEIYYRPHNLRLRQKRAETVCLKCNSGCMVRSGILKDFQKLVWFFLTGRLGQKGVY